MFDNIHKRRQKLWLATGITLSVFGTGLAIGTQFDNEILPIMIKGLIACACVFVGNSMILYLDLGLEKIEKEEASHA